MRAEFTFNTQAHKQFLNKNAEQQVNFFRKSLNANGAFDALDFEGRPLDGPQELHVTTRLVHSFALAKAAGFEDCDDVIDAGMNALWNWHRDQTNGGYFWSVKNDAPQDSTKLAYGQVFVLLAASSSKFAGHPLTDQLLADITAVIDARYWDADFGRLREEYTQDWQSFSDYRGMNANMHGTEAFLTAYEATGDEIFLDYAGQILDFFTRKMASEYNWRIPEHYDSNWNIDPNYVGNPMFRPSGTTPGHSFEFGRLLIQYWDLCGRKDHQLPIRARNLIETALEDAWSANGGLIYTISFDGIPAQTARYWWPVTEAIGALATLLKVEPKESDYVWYARLWDFADQHFIDHKHGGWFPEIDENGRPNSIQFAGKPDIYHSIQACLIPTTDQVSRLDHALRKS